MSDQEKRLDRRIVRTRKAIMEAFDKLLAIYRLDKITVSAIAREADIDRKTFYLHYSSVNDLANHKTEESIDRIAQAIREKGASKSSAERIHIALVEVNDILTEHLDVYEKIASTLSVDQFIDQFSEALQTSLTRLGVDPHFMSDPVQRMRLQCYLAGALSLYSTWLTSDHAMPSERVSDTIESAIESSVFPSVVIA